MKNLVTSPKYKATGLVFGSKFHGPQERLIFGRGFIFGGGEIMIFQQKNKAIQRNWFHFRRFVHFSHKFKWLHRIFTKFLNLVLWVYFPWQCLRRALYRHKFSRTPEGLFIFGASLDCGLYIWGVLGVRQINFIGSKQTAGKNWKNTKIYNK